MLSEPLATKQHLLFPWLTIIVPTWRHLSQVGFPGTLTQKEIRMQEAPRGVPWGTKRVLQGD